MRKTTLRKVFQREKISHRRYLAIGVFVQEYELMVDATRQTTLLCLGLPVHFEPRALIVLSHRAMTAMPLFETMRGVIGECMRYETIPEDRKQSLIQLVGQIHKEYGALAQLRNLLLHGTWRPGQAHEDLQIHKFRGKLPGGLQTSDVPTKAIDFIAAARRCRRQAKLILHLASTVLNHNFDPSVNYQNVNNAWTLRPTQN